MHNQPTNFVKPDTHKADVIKALTCVVLMFVCFGIASYAQSHNWETRYLLGFGIPGILYLLSIMGFATNNGVSGS